MSRGLGITNMNDSHLNPFVYERSAEIAGSTPGLIEEGLTIST